MSGSISNLPLLDTSIRGNDDGSSYASTPGTPNGDRNSRTTSFPMYIAVNPYQKRMDDELDLVPGDKIQVINDDAEYNDGWFFGRNLRTKKEGLYPVIFTQRITSERKPTIARARSGKRIHSPVDSSTANSSSLTLPNDSTSELPTPQPIEAASLAISKNSAINRNLSIRHTMNEIEEAMASFKKPAESKDQNVQNRYEIDDMDPKVDLTHETIISSVKDLTLADPESRPGTLENSNRATSPLTSGTTVTRLDPNLVEQWSPAEVTSFFSSLGFEDEIASQFQKHRISGKILMELELSHLKELDIDSFGTRFEVYKVMEKLKNDKIIGVHALQGFSHSENSLLMPPAFLNQNQVSQSTERMDDPPRMPASASSLPYRSSSQNSVVRTLHDDHETSHILPSRSKGILDKSLYSLSTDDSSTKFLSPRRAPTPPSHWSPALPAKSPLARRLTSNGTSRSRSLRLDSSTDKVEVTRSGSFRSALGTNSNTVSPETKRNSATLVRRTSSRKILDRSSIVPDNDLMNNDNDTTPKILEQELYKEQTEQNFDDFVGSLERPSSSIYGESQTSVYSSTEAASLGHTATDISNGESKPKRNSLFTSPFRQPFARNPSKSTSKHDNVVNKESVKRMEEQSPTHPRLKKLDQMQLRSASAKDAGTEHNIADGKNRSVSDQAKQSNKSKSTKSIPKKQQTSAFLEGLRTISVQEAMRNCDFCGLMSKKGSGAMSIWKTRFFVLHGTRLSYFNSTTDTRERGLIDITAHRVVPAKEDDKLVSLYAASTGKGRFCFKLVPPQPGFKKGLTFTQPKVHYFAVDNKEDMRKWISALIKATIDIDSTVPIISTYKTPTVSLTKAKEMMSEAREESIQREKAFNEEQSHDASHDWDQPKSNVVPALTLSSSINSNTDKGVSDLGHSSALTPNTGNIGSSRFSSPYVMASGLWSPDDGNTSGSPGIIGKINEDQEDYFSNPHNAYDEKK